MGHFVKEREIDPPAHIMMLELVRVRFSVVGKIFMDEPHYFFRCFNFQEEFLL